MAKTVADLRRLIALAPDSAIVKCDTGMLAMFKTVEYDERDHTLYIYDEQGWQKQEAARARYAQLLREQKSDTDDNKPLSSQ